MLTLGFSPCPNDTFIFHALVHGLVPGPELVPPLLADVETLNEWALAGRLDVSKLSFHAYGLVRDEYTLLAAGSALGRGCGPLLVARADQQKDLAQATVAIPGRYTTAALLLKLYGPSSMSLSPISFEQIMPQVAQGKVDYGLIIHESRFTYPDYGLRCVKDLGQWWEETTGLPIPLGGIVARRSLGEPTLTALTQAIRASVQYAFNQPRKSIDYIRQHAQEMDVDVVQSHIGLYVNDFSVDLGGEGLAAIAALLDRGKMAGIFD